MTRSMSPTLPTAGLTGLHQHRGPEWRPFPLLPEGDDHADDDSADDADDADDDSADDADDAVGADQLGDPGKQALDRMKSQRNEYREQLRQFKALGLTPAKIAELTKSAKAGTPGKPAVGDKPVDVDAIREEARVEAAMAVQRERVLDKIEAKAGGRFNIDPEDVAALVLRRHKVEDFLDGSKLDAEAIAEALDDLLEKSPKLAAQGGKRFQGGADGGHRKGDQSGKPKQLTKSDVDRMYAARQYDEIDKARAAGQLTDLLSGKS